MVSKVSFFTGVPRRWLDNSGPQIYTIIIKQISCIKGAMKQPQFQKSIVRRNSLGTAGLGKQYVIIRTWLKKKTHKIILGPLYTYLVIVTRRHYLFVSRWQSPVSTWTATGSVWKNGTTPSPSCIKTAEKSAPDTVWWCTTSSWFWDRGPRWRKYWTSWKYHGTRRFSTTTKWSTSQEGSPCQCKFVFTYKTNLENFKYLRQNRFWQN